MKKIIYLTFFCLTIIFNNASANQDLKEVYINTMVDFAKVLVCEAGNQGRVGMIAVANVIQNRVNSSKWPNNYKDVINQKHQFECMEKNVPVSPKNPALMTAIEIANAQIMGKIPTITDATHYHADWMEKYPYWSKKLSHVATIGNHIFYK